jgi:hypothetical protein
MFGNSSKALANCSVPGAMTTAARPRKTKQAMAYRAAALGEFRRYCWIPLKTAIIRQIAQTTYLTESITLAYLSEG